MFDMNTPYKFRELLGDRTFAENREQVSYIWENTWYEEEQINEYDLTLFLAQPDGNYRRFDEVHTQRSFEPETVRKLIGEAGLKLEAVLDAYSNSPLTAKSERMMFVAREVKKQVP